MKLADKIIKLLLVNFLIILIFSIITISFTHTHEELHKIIYSEYGCKKVDINYKFYGIFGASTTCLWENISTDNFNKALELNIMNEIEAYNVSYVVYSIFGFLIILINYLIVKKDIESEE